MSDKSETFSEAYNPSVSFADSSLYTREPGLRKGRFRLFNKVAEAEQKHIFVFYEGTETKQKMVLYFPTSKKQ